MYVYIYMSIFNNIFSPVITLLKKIRLLIKFNVYIYISLLERFLPIISFDTTQVKPKSFSPHEINSLNYKYFESS